MLQTSDRDCLGQSQKTWYSHIFQSPSPLFFYGREHCVSNVSFSYSTNSSISQIYHKDAYDGWSCLVSLSSLNCDFRRVSSHSDEQEAAESPSHTVLPTNFSIPTNGFNLDPLRLHHIQNCQSNFSLSPRNCCSTVTTNWSVTLEPLGISLIIFVIILLFSLWSSFFSGSVTLCSSPTCLNSYSSTKTFNCSSSTFFFCYVVTNITSSNKYHLTITKSDSQRPLPFIFQISLQP